MTTATESASQKPRVSDNAAGILRDRIREGLYPPGQWFPTERELTQDLNVHRRVVRAAIGQLEKEGLLIRNRYCRPIVRESQASEPPGNESPSLVSGSRLIALVMYHGGTLEQNGSAQQRIFWSLNQALGRVAYHAVFLDLEDVGTPRENAEREANHLRYVMDQGFAGVVFYAYAYNDNRDLIREVSRKMPLVLIDRTLTGIDADFVGVQNFRATYDTTKYLLALGHRRIAYVTKPEPINTVQDRLQGYLSALNDEFGSDFFEMVLSTPSVGVDWPNFDIIFGLPAEKRPTAIICVNDYEAVRVAKRLSRLNLRVPQDVSVIGYDDIVERLPDGPTLTTIAQPFEDIGREATRLLLRRFEKPGIIPVHIELPSRLVVRNSVSSLLPSAVSASQVLH